MIKKILIEKIILLARTITENHPLCYVPSHGCEQKIIRMNRFYFNYIVKNIMLHEIQIVWVLKMNEIENLNKKAYTNFLKDYK